jgi:hypothetical protein
MFVVGEEPYCVWEWDLKERNLEFIGGLNPDFFKHIVGLNRENLDAEENQVAALAIRMAYFHGLETLFSLICATIQAPDCVVGWLQKYRLWQLRDLIKSISNQDSIMTKLQFKKISWLGISNLVNSFKLEDEEKTRRIKEEFGNLWKRLADEILHKDYRFEYNSIKHGLRVVPGGVTVSIGEEKEYGVPPPREEFFSLGGSIYGSTFYIPQEILDQNRKHRKIHFRVKKQTCNWNPDTLRWRLLLISNSLRNIISYLRIVNGVNARTVQFSWPADLSVFQRAWEPMAGVTSFCVDAKISEEHISVFTPDDIVNAYKK